MGFSTDVYTPRRIVTACAYVLAVILLGGSIVGWGLMIHDMITEKQPEPVISDIDQMMRTQILNCQARFSEPCMMVTFPMSAGPNLLEYHNHLLARRPAPKPIKEHTF